MNKKEKYSLLFLKDINIIARIIITIGVLVSLASCIIGVTAVAENVVLIYSIG